jgi:hypothetical protein
MTLPGSGQPDMVDGPLYRKELVARRIDHAARACRAERESRKRGQNACRRVATRRKESRKPSLLLKDMDRIFRKYIASFIIPI